MGLLILHRIQPNWKHMYSYGLEFAIDGAGDVIFAEKEGINAGVSAVIRHYPGQDIHVVLLSNMQMGAWEPIKFIHGMLV